MLPAGGLSTGGGSIDAGSSAASGPISSVFQGGAVNAGGVTITSPLISKGDNKGGVSIGSTTIMVVGAVAALGLIFLLKKGR